MIGIHRPAWRSRGWMSFTLANGAVLHLGGPSAVAPTTELSVGTFLSAGIPQNADKTAFNDDTHTIKHAVIEIMSSGATTDPPARTMTNGSTPTTSLGRYRRVNEVIELHNSRSEIFGFKLFNRSGGNMVIDVEVFE